MPYHLAKMNGKSNESWFKELEDKTIEVSQEYISPKDVNKLKEYITTELDRIKDKQDDKDKYKNMKNILGEMLDKIENSKSLNNTQTIKLLEYERFVTDMEKEVGKRVQKDNLASRMLKEIKDISPLVKKLVDIVNEKRGTTSENKLKKLDKNIGF